jgi:hypothetical protein
MTQMQQPPTLNRSASNSQVWIEIIAFWDDKRFHQKWWC